MAEDKIRVETSDGKTVEVDSTVVKKWGFFKGMIEIFSGIENLPQPVQLKEVSSDILAKIIEWTNHHLSDPKLDEPLNENQRKKISIPDWDQQFLRLEQHILLGIMLAANYLDLQLLVEMTCKTVAELIKGKTPEQVRQYFHIPNDLPPLPAVPELPPSFSQSVTTAPNT